MSQATAAYLQNRTIVFLFLVRGLAVWTAGTTRPSYQLKLYIFDLGRGIIGQIKMYDSQRTDYLEIINSLLSSRRQWEQVPQIVNLSIKAMTRLFEEYSQSFLEHKTLINEQSIQMRELELSLKDKVSKKQVQGELNNVWNSKDPKRQEDSVSQYDRLVKESRYSRNNPPTIEELKTIAEIVAEKQGQETRHNLKNDLLSQKLEIEDKISRLREELKGKISDIEREKKEFMSECRQTCSRIEESHARPAYGQTQEKMSLLQMSNKRMTEGMSHLVNHIQQNFLTKQEVNLLMEKQREKKSPAKVKARQHDKKYKNEETQLQKELQKLWSRIKGEHQRQWNQFRQTVMKEIGKMVNSQTVNNLIDTFQKQNSQKYKNVTNSIRKLESKLDSLPKQLERPAKQIHIKSQKRSQKRSSPSKSIQSIQHSLQRLQRTIVDKQAGQIKTIQKQVEQRINSYDQRLIKQLDRRQMHLCEVIEQTYNQFANAQGQDQGGNIKGALKKLFSTNLYSRYIYIGSKECRKDNCIPWQKEALNNVVDNFVWKKDIILINAPGIYKVEVGLYGDVQTEPMLLVNGDPVAELTRAPNSRTSGTKMRGAILSQVLLLPAKAKISVRVGEHFHGQAFIELRQM